MGSVVTDSVGSSGVAGESHGGLGNQSLLDKIDKLRELNLGNIVPLPQLVVVGDQSSGKSSVLESLTGFSFPRASGLCTRYATQITCRRESQKGVAISIIPRSSATPAEKERMKQFHTFVTDLSAGELADVFEEANRAMGIRPIDDDGYGLEPLSTFSEDILKIEISGPEQNHLTVIDVPGIFRTATPGLTTESDIPLVRDMVKRYMKDSRTIILAVVPCNVDIATQEVLELAREADPSGIRTMGVLTKPDLAIERVMQQAVLDLVIGKRNDLRLGYCVVKNRRGDDTKSSLRECHAQEKSFFRNEPWTSIASMDRTGVESLKQRLSELLMDISRREFPQVKADINKKLAQYREKLHVMGPSRSDSNAQRLYLGKIATQFQRIANYALNAYYTDDPIFSEQPDLRLITRVIELNEVFSNVFWEKAHTRLFHSDSGKDSNENQFGADKVGFRIPIDEYPELHDIILTDEFECPDPDDSSLMDRIEEVFNSSRGPELGTFGGSILATIFKEQSGKWEQLVLSHVSNAIVLVHHFITKLLEATFPEKQVREEFWDNILLDKLCDAYTAAMKHARFLLAIEREGKPTTYNHYFNSNLQSGRIKRLQDNLRNMAAGEEVKLSTMDLLRRLTIDKSNATQVREDIHDILASYYRVARKRFVDVVCQQVVDHFLLTGPDSPLRALGPDLVMALGDAQLENIAGEDAGSRRQRQVLGSEIQSLVEAVRVLKG